MTKLWDKSTELKDEHSQLLKATVEKFTVGQDREWDLYLAPFDVQGSIAHVQMLAQTQLLKAEIAEPLVQGLREIYQEIKTGSFKLEPGIEDVHSQVELLLTRRLGEAGKSIHMARSRNDQVLVDLKLFLRNEILELTTQVETFFTLLLRKSEEFKGHLMPGYTHLQIAMPSSFGLWFGAYAESLIDDLVMLHAAFEVVNKNPLGSAAGYGSSFPIDRSLTTRLLGFGDLDYNVVYAQMGRGKSERIVAMAIANFADTLARMSMDACLYLNQNFDFIKFPDALTTGSSIMPHKKNPDVFELIRARCNRMKGLSNEIFLLTTNLPSGYHRDLQLLKEHLFPVFQELKDCMTMAGVMFEHITVKPDILAHPQYQYLFSVEAVNRLVLDGASFRDAYRTVGEQIENGTYKVNTQELAHTHEGSIGNLGHEFLARRMRSVLSRFPAEAIHLAVARLVSN